MTLSTILTGFARSFFWQEQLLPKDVFNESIMQFAELTYTEQDCLSECVESVKMALQPADYDLSAASQAKINSLLTQFGKIVEKTPYLSVLERLSLKVGFNHQLTAAISKKWADSVARSFYRISSVKQEEEKAKNIQLWTYSCFSGSEFLKRCESEIGPTISKDITALLEKKISAALRAYGDKEAQTQKTQRRFEQTSTHFQMLNEVEVSSDEEAIDLHQLANDVNRDRTAKCSQIDEKIELLNKCIWKGYEIRKKNSMILDLAQEVFFHFEKNIIQRS